MCAGKKRVHKTTPGGIKTLNRPVICQISEGNNVFFPEQRLPKAALRDRLGGPSRLPHRFHNTGDGSMPLYVVRYDQQDIVGQVGRVKFARTGEPQFRSGHGIPPICLSSSSALRTTGLLEYRSRMRCSRILA